MVVDRREQQDPDAGAAAGAVHEPDPEGLRGPAAPADAVRVRVHAEDPAPPADEQPDRQADDQQADRGLGSLFHLCREVGLEEHDRHAEQEQARRVAEAP